jgi:hypothetical protein
MAKKKLLEDILRNPARFYRLPGDVLRDRRFDDGERAEILGAWAAADDARGPEIAAARSELESRGVHHAAE